jgi:hypothetical protein
LSKVHATEAFKSGIKYAPPHSLVGTSGEHWVFQPHPDLYETLATNVLEHYGHYQANQIDKTYMPAYFYLGGAGTGKSRHASEFASSIQEAITLRTQHPLYHDLAQRLKTAFVFHVSFENGTPLTAEERGNPWEAVGVRMLHQLLDEPIEDIRSRYVAEPSTVFRLVAAAEKVDLYDDFTGILVVDGIQKVITEDDDGRDKTSAFYGFLTQIASLSLMSRTLSRAKELRRAPFIMTCVTATHFGPPEGFLADSHRKRVYLPLNRLKPPAWKEDNSPVLNDSPVTRFLVDDVGGHARAMELIADVLARYQNKREPSIAELADTLHFELMNRYEEAISVLQGYTLHIVQCILSRQRIRLPDLIPGSNVRWEHVTASGLTWFERTETNYDTYGYLVAPYIWIWMLARLPASKNTESLRKFLRNWQFNDYAELLHLATGEGPPGNTTWQSFEVFCCSFRILRSLGFGDGQEVPLESLHAGCKLRDDRDTVVVNKHLNIAEATHQYRTDSMARKRVATSKARSAEEVDTQHSGTLNRDAQFSHVIRNGTGAPAGDFFFSIEIPTPRAPNGRGDLGEAVREVGQCKLLRTKKLTQATYNAERKKSAGPDDIFMLYTRTETEISDVCALPDRSGLVDKSCWESYFGPFSGRAYMALQCSSSQD